MIALSASIYFALMFGAFTGLCGFGFGWGLKGDANRSDLEEQYAKGMARGIIDTSVMLEERGIAEVTYQ